MYNRQRAKMPSNITLDWILSKVDEYDIYKAYLDWADEALAFINKNLLSEENKKESS